MSANEHSAKTDSVHEVSEPVAEAVSEKRLVLRDTVIAGLALLVLALGLALYFTLTARRADKPMDGAQEVSAATWIKPEAVAAVPVAPTLASETQEGASLTPTPVAPAAPTATATYAPGPADEASGSPVDGEGAAVRHGTVQSGVPVITSLQNLGLSMQQAHALITSLNGVFDFRRSHPGDAFELSLDSSGGPAHFLYRASLTEVYEVNKQGGELKGRKKIIPTVQTERRFGGTIASSLYKTLQDLSAHPSLAGNIVEVLANEVDFYKEQRPGDTFRVIVDEESLNGEFLGYGPVIALEYKGVKSGMKRFFRFSPDDDSVAEYYSAKGISQPRSLINIPLHYTRLSSLFGNRFHPVLKRRQMHNGVDFSAPPGTPVWACRDGIVTIAANKGANGNLVAILHDDDLQSFYAHLLRFEKGIKPGVKVKARQVVGYVGSTGRSTGPHLHFGLKKRGRFIDPLSYKVQPGHLVAVKYRPKLMKIIQTNSATLDKVAIKPPSEPLAEHKEGAEDALGVEDW